MRSITVEATTDNLSQVMEFVDGQLETIDCPMKTQMKIDIAVEEIFVNIAHYAYATENGNAEICFESEADNSAVTITFADRGAPYNPLEKSDPDTTLSADEREIGGLGIFMVKKSMDCMEYEYKDDKNVLTLVIPLS